MRRIPSNESRGYGTRRDHPFQVLPIQPAASQKLRALKSTAMASWSGEQFFAKPRGAKVHSF